jgi:hypothetical protein
MRGDEEYEGRRLTLAARWQTKCEGVWYWCLHCSRIYQPRDAVRGNGVWLCPCGAVTRCDWFTLSHAVMEAGVVQPAELVAGALCPGRARRGNGERVA